MAELFLGPIEVSLVLSAPEALSLLTYMMDHDVLVEHQKFIPRRLEPLETVTLRFFRSTYDFTVASVLDEAGIVTVSHLASLKHKFEKQVHNGMVCLVG